MANRPKSISIQQLSGAVHSALGKVKVPPPPEGGPFLIINPGIICGLIFVGPNVEAQTVAAHITKELSAHAGISLSPVVQESGAGTGAVAPAAFPHRPVVLGYKADVNVHV